MENKDMNLWQKMAAIQAEVQDVPKNGYNKFSNYNYVMAVDIVESVRKLLTKYNLVCTVKEVDMTRSLEGIKEDKKNFHTVIKCIGTFINADKPEEREEVPYFAIAADTLDKDIYKAKTGGIKYLFIQTFKIPSDLIDPEDDRDEAKMTGAAIPKVNPPAQTKTVTTDNKVVSNTTTTTQVKEAETLTPKVDPPKQTGKSLSFRKPKVDPPKGGTNGTATL